MHRIFRAFIDNLSNSRDRTGLQNTFENVSVAFDLRCFAYLIMPTQPGTEADLISTYLREWTAHYLKCHYERLDPVIQQAQTNTEPFEWGGAVR